MQDTANLPAIDVSYVKELSVENVEQRRYSTLDLCSFDRFTLIAGSPSAWTARFQEIEEAVRDRGVSICMRIAGEDFDFVDQKQADLFAVKARLSVGVALLVRPDQHILAVLRADSVAEEVAKAIFTHLGY